MTARFQLRPGQAMAKWRWRRTKKTQDRASRDPEKVQVPNRTPGSHFRLCERKWEADIGVYVQVLMMSRSRLRMNH